MLLKHIMDFGDESATPPFSMESSVHEPIKRGTLQSEFKTDSESLSPSSQHCVVCEDQSDGLHFGQLTCRACAAFFRRTVSLKLDYVCKHSGICDIHKSARNMCRSCRYQKCLTKGMQVSAVQQARDSLGKRKDRSNGDRANTKSTSPKSSVEHPQPMAVTPTQGLATHVIQTSTSTPTSSEYASITPDIYWNNQVMTNGVIGITASPAPNYNVINQFSTMHLNQLNPAFVAPREEMRILPKIAEGFDQFSTLMQASMDIIKEQRDQACPTFPNANEIILHESNFSESKKVCKMEYSILMKIVDGYFCPFNELDQKDKNYLFESFFCIFSNTHRAYRTYEVFGQNPNDDRLIMPDGGFVQISNLEKFYDNSPLIKVPAMAVANMFKDAMLFVKEAIVAHMRRIKITRMEMCFIFGVFLWRDSKCACGCENCDAVTNLSENAINIAHQTRDILLKDVHIYYRLSGLSDFQITQKIGNLLLMIPKLEKSATMFKDNYQIGDLFNMIETDSCCTKLNKVNL
uniref:Nuclear receptor domain-containing protein n=1 Tax=Steinernema glaseri TaxID=37863 RepID=A0A1I8A9G4_9BILA